MSRMAWAGEKPMSQARHHPGYTASAPRPAEVAPGGGPDRYSSPALPPADPADTPGSADELTRGLTHLGLTVHEAQMYRAVARNGPVTARHAIVASQLDRATGYRILARLTARGLVVPTGRRPHRFVGLDVGRLLDRTTVFLRDEVDLHRVVRSLYLAGTPPRTAPGEDGEPVVRAPLLPRTPIVHKAHLIPKDEEFATELIQRIGSARQEVHALSRPGVLLEPARVELARAIVRATERGIRVQLVLDYRATDLEFLAELVPAGGGNIRPEVRIWTPQLGRLWIIDRKLAVRGFGAMAFPRPGGGPLVASEDDEFVRQNMLRFESIWREATPLSLDAHDLASFGREPTPSSPRASPSAAGRRSVESHETTLRALMPDGSELALGRMFRR